jgi:hypothetical protein
VADVKVPRKYWWVAVVAVPVVLAIIAILPGVLKSSGGSSGGTNTTISGNNNTVSFDYSTHNTFVTNVNVIAREYELLTGRPLSGDLRQQVEAAVAAAMQRNHAASVRLFEKVAEGAQFLPSTTTFASVCQDAVTKPARAPSRLSKAKIAELAEARRRNRPLAADALKSAAEFGCCDAH